MIVDIKKGGYVKGLIEYHEKKVSEGKALLLYDQTLSDNKNERITTFLETAELNDHVYRNKFMHVSISFAKEDSALVDPELMVSIGNKYLEEMGINDNPVLIYEHADKKHKHFHIVTTTMDYTGKKIPEFNDHYRSQLLSRKLEKEFKLQETMYVNKFQEKLKEINSTKYRIFNALSSNNPGFIAESAPYIATEMITEIKSNKLSDHEINEKILIRGNEQLQIAQIYRLLKKHDLYYSTKKQQLKEKLHHLKEISKSRDEFLSRVEGEGIYVRKVATNNNAYSLTYGLSDLNFYVKEKDLPMNLRYDYLFTEKKITLGFDQAQQKKYLQKVINSALTRSTTLSEFENNLLSNNIQWEYASNARGVYGVSFLSKNVPNATLFKGSEISRAFSWDKISKQLSIHPGLKPNAVTPSVQAPTAGPSLPGIIQAIRGSSKASDAEEKERKRKRDQDERDNQKDF